MKNLTTGRTADMMRLSSRRQYLFYHIAAPVAREIAASLLKNVPIIRHGELPGGTDPPSRLDIPPSDMI